MNEKESCLNRNNCTLNELEIAQRCAPTQVGFIILQGIQLLYRGYTIEEVADIMKRSLRTVKRWVRNFNLYGLEGVLVRKNTGRPRKISLETFNSEYVPILSDPKSVGEHFWSGIKFHGYLVKECKEEVSYRTVLNYFRKSGLSFIKGRPCASKRNEEDRIEFLERFKEYSEDPNIELWFQDETGFEGDPRPRRKWVPRGTTYSHTQLGAHLRYQALGAVNPRSGEAFMLGFTCVDSDVFQAFIDKFQTDITTDKKIVMVLDNASWHTSKKIEWGNITPLFLPPYSPDMNPIENLWKYIKFNFFNGWYAKTIEELTERVCYALNKIIKDPIQIKKTANMDYLCRP